MKSFLTLILFLVCFWGYNKTFAQNITDNYIERANKHYENEETEEAIAYYKLALVEDPSNINAKNGLFKSLLLLVGVRVSLFEYLDNSEKDITLDYCNDLIEYFPDEAISYYFKGLFVFNDTKSKIASAADILNGNLSEEIISSFKNAISIFNRALDIDDTYSSVYYYRGYTYFILSDKDKALNDFSLAIKNDKEYTMAYYMRSLCYNYKREYNQSIQDLSMCIFLDPTNTEYYVARGFAYLNLDKELEACSDFKIANEYGSEEAAQYLLRYCNN